MRAGERVATAARRRRGEVARPASAPGASRSRVGLVEVARCGPAACCVRDRRSRRGVGTTWPRPKPAIRPAAAATVTQRRTCEWPLMTARAAFGKAMTRAGRSSASRRRAICACCAARRSAGKASSASARSSSRDAERASASNAANRARQSAQASRCGSAAGPPRCRPEARERRVARDGRCPSRFKK